VNVLNTLKQVSEVCSIFCATADPVELVVAETELGRGILGVIDGAPPVGVETVDDEADPQDAAAEDRLHAVRVQHPTGPGNITELPEDGRIRQCACQAAAGTFSLAGLLRGAR
jgi:hypothetical protein